MLGYEVSDIVEHHDFFERPDDVSVQRRIAAELDRDGRPVPEHKMRERRRIYDRGVDGSECQWARVLAYEPPERVVFSWDISPQWQIETDLEKTSEVEVRFIAETPQRTRVELEHHNLDRHGEGWHSEREGVASEGGWPLYLQRFADLIND